MYGGMIDMESNTTLVQCYPAHEAVPDGDGPFPGVVVAHDRFGLSPHVKGIANRLAHSGFYALAPDFYALPTSVADAAPEMMRPSRPSSTGDKMEADERAAALSAERGAAIFRQAIGYARTRSRVRSGGLGLLGFSMGGRLAYFAAAANPEDVRGCACFTPPGLAGEAAARTASAIQTPLLLLYAELDTRISRRERETVRERLAALGLDFEMEVLPDAGEDFFNEESDGYRIRASKAAWQKTLAFFGRCL